MMVSRAECVTSLCNMDSPGVADDTNSWCAIEGRRTPLERRNRKLILITSKCAAPQSERLGI